MRLAVILAVSALALNASRPAIAQTAPPAQAAQQQQQQAEPMTPLFCTVTAAHKCEGGVCTKVDSFGDIITRQQPFSGFRR